MAHVIFKNVSKNFQRKTGDLITSLDQVNFSIEEGSTTAIIGTNGAGKSTLFNALTRQIDIDSGEIYLSGQRIDQMSLSKVVSKIGQVFQNPSHGTAPRMTVFENLVLAEKRGEKRGLALSLSKKKESDLANYLSKFHLDLENRLDVPIEFLSGGQRQIISLIMATLKQPELLLLDEHTAALDPRTARQVMEITQTMVRDFHLTTLMITHHLADAIKYADQILVLHRGRIVNSHQRDEITHLSTTDLYEELENLNTSEE
ncbi:ABC transporter ATP-binding protein [Eremococcus coleocola]|uniref:ABC transporter ATP-binding protein n=1 Tax=Eremococcus coleocola TaxID=88132 RepID=UPI0004088CEF|nr:ATP-binding cassette domain-containing protein [Eremococcus coleocola]